jgi:AcrR family transcriptional regulator
MRGARSPTARPSAPAVAPAVGDSDSSTPHRTTHTAHTAAGGKRPYKQVARAEAQQRTRAALLDAAVEEFTQGRWEKVSLQGLARRAKVSKQTLLRHFGSKDGLLMQALASSAAEALEQRWSAHPGDIEGAVENVLDHYEGWGERSLRIGAWLDSGPPQLAHLSQMARQMHYNWIEFAFGPQLERRHGDERERCRAALIVLCDVQTWWLLSHDLGFERAAVRATLTTAIERLLGEGAKEGEVAEPPTRQDKAQGTGRQTARRDTKETLG